MQCLNNTRKPTIIVPEAYRISGRNLSSNLYLDFVQVVVKGLNFDITGYNVSKSFLFYPKAYRKPFQEKHFLAFDVKGHSYYLGKYGAMDCHIIFKSISGTCNCSESGVNHIDEETAHMIFQLVVLKSFSKLGFDVLSSRNVIIQDNDTEEDFENLSSAQFTEFNMRDFENSFFKEEFEGSCNRLADAGYSFFIEHEPHLVFLKYGQNVEILQTNDVKSQVESDFDVSKASQVSLSIACNNKHCEVIPDDIPTTTPPGTPILTNISPQDQPSSSNTTSDTDCDPDVSEIIDHPPIGGKFSISFSRYGIQKMFMGERQRYDIYTKGFNSGFCNFQSKNVLRSFLRLQTYGFVLHGLQGYSIIAHLMRRSQSSEPFYKRPLSMLFKASSKKAKEKYYKQLIDDFLLVEKSVDESMSNGCGYRVEVTLTTEMIEQGSVLDLNE